MCTNADVGPGKGGVSPYVAALVSSFPSNMAPVFILCTNQSNCRCVRELGHSSVFNFNYDFGVTKTKEVKSNHYYAACHSLPASQTPPDSPEKWQRRNKHEVNYQLSISLENTFSVQRHCVLMVQ